MNHRPNITYTDPHAVADASIVAIPRCIWRNRHLIIPMIKREVVGRYRGSILGLFWSFAHPLLMLSVYTFAFSVVFKARWGEMEETKAQFATIAFVGMIVHGLLADVVTRAPALILSHVNFVKKVVFPLEILPIVLLGSALFHYAVNLSVLLLALLVTSGGWHWTIILIPFVLLPFSIMASGIAWALASLGVYIRDIGQIASILMTVAMFLSPVFYPLSAIPEKYHYIILASPLTFIIEQARAVLVFGRLPHWKGLLVYYIVASGVAWLGFAWFQKTRKGFADVL